MDQFLQDNKSDTTSQTIPMGGCTSHRMKDLTQRTLLRLCGEKQGDYHIAWRRLSTGWGLVSSLDKETMGIYKNIRRQLEWIKNVLCALQKYKSLTSKIEEKVQPYYQQVGITSENTSISFKEDGTFTSKIVGTPFNGQYSFDEATQKITLKSLFLSVNCYAKKETGGISILFEGKKLLTLLQTMSAFSGNKDLQTISELSKKYDGVRIGFDMNK